MILQIADYCTILQLHDLYLFYFKILTILIINQTPLKIKIVELMVLFQEIVQDLPLVQMHLFIAF